MASMHRGPLARQGCVVVARVLMSAALVGVLLIGCSGRDRLHPAFRLDDDELTRAISRGKRVAATGDPDEAFRARIVDVNTQISSDVILRKAGPCWPADEIAYQIACSGDTSDAGIKKATKVGLKVIAREMRFTAIVQIPKTSDTASIKFALRTGQGTEYPPIAVETPVYIRDVNPIFDRTAPPAALYRYTVHFAVLGGPGVPPIGPTVRSLAFVVKADDSEASVRFAIPRDREKR
jgi:hypothetical protein